MAVYIRLATCVAAVAACLLLGLSTGVAQSLATITFDRPTLQSGETGEVEVRLDCGDAQCSLFAIALAFDPGQFSVDSVRLGIYLGQQASGTVFIIDNSVDNQAGQVTLSAAALGMPPPPADDLLFTMTVTSLVDGPVNFEVTSLELGDLAANPVIAMVRIIDEEPVSGSPTITVTPRIIVVTATPQPTQPVTVVTATPSGPLAITYARVFTQYGDTLNLRANPSTSADAMEELPFGAVVSVLSGPVSGEGYVWWQVLSPTGQIGWSVESADNVQTLLFSSALTPASVVGYANVGAPPRYTFGQTVTVAAAADVWTRPAPAYGRVRWTASSATNMNIRGVPFGGYLSNGTPVWWYFVRIPGRPDLDGWVAEHQIISR
ncbi:MAG: SH3 domain-containing protein [Chloroflexi bacterium]|nr:SH3 domain-containing protein [Chloroflexota bacterium]